MVQDLVVDRNRNLLLSAASKLPNPTPVLGSRQLQVPVDLFRRRERRKRAADRPNERRHRTPVGAQKRLNRGVVVRDGRDDRVPRVPRLLQQGQVCRKRNGLERFRREPAEIPVRGGDLKEKLAARRLADEVRETLYQAGLSRRNEAHDAGIRVLIIGNLNEARRHLTLRSPTRLRKRPGSPAEKRAMSSSREL